MKILGIDLGVSSIGWAIVEETQKDRKVLGLGSRIIPLSKEDNDEFSKGNTITKNQKRTQKRTQRKGYDRYQLRRKKLKEALEQQKMLPDDSVIKLSALELWGLRGKAVSEQISLPQLGRVLLHLNQKRGYKSSRADANLERKDTDYVQGVKDRHQVLKSLRKTIGQYFYENLLQDEHYRIKQQVYPREAYIEEFDAICAEQRKYYSTTLTPAFIDLLKNEIIYYQRKLKSQKDLVRVCDFEGFYVAKKESGKLKELFVGPRVAPRSSPLFQIAKIWETINNIAIKNKRNLVYLIPLEKKVEIFQYLDNNERLSESELFKILDLKKTNGWHGNKQTSKGLQGNVTKTALLRFLGQESHLLSFQLCIEQSDKETFIIDRKTGEITGSNTIKKISANVEKEPFYQLWHTIYSIDDPEECTRALIKRFGLGEETASKLASIDFKKFAFGSKSIKSIRKILPYLMEGYVYSDAASLAGYNHSNSLTTDERVKRKLLNALPNLPKNSLRQPVVEKILNQLINLVNSLIDENNGWVTKEEREKNQFEIRIELARELKQSKEERNETYSRLEKRERENDNIRKRIEAEYKQFGVRASRLNVIKWRLFHEINNHENKLNAICIYCGQPFSLSEALKGSSVDIEHIIPKSLFFDDSQSNKTLCHRKCNSDKNNTTAYDFMKSKSNEQFNDYIERVDSLYKKKIINKTKRDKLLMSVKNIPQDFIDRQLRETQYIAKKSKEILEQICRTVWSTSGSVTAYLRSKWGWDEVTMNLQLPKYRNLGLTEWKEWETNDGQKHKREVINNWSKRDDHRHHAIDALTIACTKQSFIQRMNTLSAQHTRDEMFAELQRQSAQFKERLALLDRYIISNRPFTTIEVEDEVDKVLVSFKAGKRVVTVNRGTLVPRGALSEESVYGKIKILEKGKPVKHLFENPKTILKKYIQTLVEGRLLLHGNDPKKALASLKKEPIYLDSEKTKLLEYGTVYREEIVYRYPINMIKAKDLPYIVDAQVQKVVKARLELYNNNEKEAFKNLDENPIWFNEEKRIPIKAVRMITGLTAVEPVKRNESGKNIGFVKPGNNHHIALYLDENGKKQEHVCTFWHAVERRKNNFPSIIKNPTSVWDIVLKNKDNYSKEFLEKLPNDKWTFIESLQQNEMFILGLSTTEANEAISTQDYKTISRHLYRVQKLTSCDYYFRSHLETQVDDSDDAKRSKRYFRFKSVSAFENMTPIKVIVNNVGKVIMRY